MNNTNGNRVELNDQNERGVRVAECSFVFQAWTLAWSIEDIKLMNLQTCGVSVAFWPKKIIKVGRNYWPRVEADLIVECYELVADRQHMNHGVRVFVSDDEFKSRARERFREYQESGVRDMLVQSSLVDDCWDRLNRPQLLRPEDQCVKLDFGGNS